MSLINDMLKDLERTRNGKAAGPSLLTGVQAVSGVTRRGARKPVLAGLILLAGLGLGFGLRLLLPVATPSQQIVDSAAPAAAPAPAPVIEPVAVPVQPAVAASEPPPVTQDMTITASPAPAPDPAPEAPAPAPKVAPAASQPAVAKVVEKPAASGEASPARAPQPEPAPVVAAVSPNPPKAAAPKPAVPPAPAPVKTVPTAAALLQEARGLMNNGQDNLAAERLAQALILEPAAFAPRDQLADLHLRHGRRAAAMEVWRAGVKLAPTEVYWRKRLARALLEDGDGASAVELLQGGAQPTVAADVEFYGLLAAAYQRQGEPSRAAAVYRRLAEQEPRGGIWWLGLAIALEGLRDGEGAKNAYQQALTAEGLGEDARNFAAGRLNQLAR